MGLTPLFICVPTSNLVGEGAFVRLFDFFYVYWMTFKKEKKLHPFNVIEHLSQVENLNHNVGGTWIAVQLREPVSILFLGRRLIIFKRGPVKSLKVKSLKVKS